jgi:hypothetical protein
MTDLCQLTFEELARKVGAAVLQSELIKKVGEREFAQSIEGAREGNQALISEINRRLGMAETRIEREKLDMAIHRNLRDGLKAADDPLRLRQKRREAKETA